MTIRDILAPVNANVSKIYSITLKGFRRNLYFTTHIFYIFYYICQPDGALQFTPEVLKSVYIAHLSSHELKLKTNTIIMFLRSPDLSERLCNCTRLIVTDIRNNIIRAKLITGEHFGHVLHITRITVDSNKGQLGFTMQYHQFSVRPIAAHKAHEQILDILDKGFRVSVFMRRILYVAFSSVKRRSGLKVLIPKDCVQ